ncbi:MAG: hypothetical protein ACREPM_21465 [Gemmatimonadaceae bacterium]
MVFASPAIVCRRESGPHAGELPTPAGRAASAGDDAIRVPAVAIVFLVHVAEPFNPWDEWRITNGHSLAHSEPGLFLTARTESPDCQRRRRVASLLSAARVAPRVE